MVGELVSGVNAINSLENPPATQAPYTAQPPVLRTIASPMYLVGQVLASPERGISSRRLTLLSMQVLLANLVPPLFEAFHELYRLFFAPAQAMGALKSPVSLKRDLTGVPQRVSVDGARDDAGAHSVSRPSFISLVNCKVNQVTSLEASERPREAATF